MMTIGFGRYRDRDITTVPRGYLRWLRDNHGRVGRPDSVSRTQALWSVASEFARTRHYDFFDRHDLGPFIAELRNTTATVLRSRNMQAPTKDLGSKGVLRVG